MNGIIRDLRLLGYKMPLSQSQSPYPHNQKPSKQFSTYASESTMQLRALLTFSILAACMAVTALPSSDTVKYGSGSSFVERAPAAFGNCNIDPGAICGTLATACAGALTDSDASVVWQTITCVCAGLWYVGPFCSQMQFDRHCTSNLFFSCD